MKKLAVIGANRPLIPFYKRAKELGYLIYGFAWEEGAVCKSFCDEFFPISFTEKEQILNICQKIGIDGITSFSLESALPTVIYVAQEMHLISNSLSCLKLTEDKYTMREALKKAGVSVPDYHLITQKENLFSINWNFPLIVKPVDNGGSKGVTKVEDFKQLLIAFDRALQHSPKKEVIIEQYIDGREFSVEYISHNKQHYYLTTTDKETSESPYFIELAHHQPANIPEVINEKIKQTTEKSLTALNIYNSPSHTEIKLDSKGNLYIIEIGPRLGGDHITSDLVKLSTGYDLIEGAIKLCLNEFNEPSIKFHKYSGIYYLTPITKWVLNYIQHSNDFSEIVYTEVLNPTNTKLESNLDRNGCFIYQANTKFTHQ